MRLPGRPSRPPRVSTRGAVRGPAGRSDGETGRAIPGRRGAAQVGGPGRPRRSERLQRFTPARAAALLGILASLGSIYGLAATSAFTYSRADIPELHWTPRADVEAAIGIQPGTNLFRLSVDPIERRLRSLSAVAEARVVVALPDALVVSVTEREAILVWSIGPSGFLVDRQGVIFAVADPAAADAAGLPVITDSRPVSAALIVGDTVDPVDLDAATRLGSLRPADIGSVADALDVTISEANGFVVGTSPASWVAIFGLYTPTVRTPAIVPGQVQLLRSLLDGREALIAQVILADARNGTFIPKPTPVASP